MQFFNCLSMLGIFVEHDSIVYVVPTGMEEAPKAALDIRCLQRGGRAALTQTINFIPPLRGDGGTWALTA